MLQVRLGSYWMLSTSAGWPSLSRLKSMIRYIRLAPPPRCRQVILPLKFLPPCFLTGSSSLFSGVVLVTSSRRLTELNRLPAEVFLYTWIAMTFLNTKTC